MQSPVDHALVFSCVPGRIAPRVRAGLVVALGFATSACFSVENDGVDPSPAENVIGTAAPLAYAATLSMAVLAGSPTTCAELVAGCTVPPCEVEIGVTVGDGCHLPIGADAATGRVPVTGTFSTPDDASLVAVFQDIDVSGTRVIFRRGAFTTTRNGSGLSMAYGNQGLEVTESNVGVDQAAWTVQVDVAGTPGDTSDDTLEISGAQQIVIDTEITQVAVVGAVLSPECRLNPTAGQATIEVVGDEGGGVTTLQFHDDCDGEADVAASVGASHIAIGETVRLNLFR